MNKGDYALYRYRERNIAYALVVVGSKVLSIHLEAQPPQIAGEAPKSLPTFAIKDKSAYGLAVSEKVGCQLNDAHLSVITLLENATTHEGVLEAYNTLLQSRELLIGIFMTIISE